MSTSVFLPGQESETNDKGQIAFDVGELMPVGHFRDDSFSQASVTRTEVLDFGDECFLLHGLLTPDECRYYTDKGEELQFKSVIGAKDEVRSQQRISFKSEELAQLLWERVSPFLTNVAINGDPHLQHIHGVELLMNGDWQPKDLNDMFRLCRYLPTGHFSPHFDGYYQRSATERSLQTLMLYLNGNFSAGSTNFVDDSQTLYKDESGKYCAEEKNILCRIQPECGMGIIFNHQRLHEGQKLGDGKKYILRTDVMYTNTSPAVHSEADQKALMMFQEAERKEGCGECLEAAELYRKAFKLSPSLAEAYGS